MQIASPLQALSQSVAMEHLAALLTAMLLGFFEEHLYFRKEYCAAISTRNYDGKNIGDVPAQRDYLKLDWSYDKFLWMAFLWSNQARQWRQRAQPCWEGRIQANRLARKRVCGRWVFQCTKTGSNPVYFFRSPCHLGIDLWTLEAHQAPRRLVTFHSAINRIF